MTTSDAVATWWRAPFERARARILRAQARRNSSHRESARTPHTPRACATTVATHVMARARAITTGRNDCRRPRSARGLVVPAPRAGCAVVPAVRRGGQRRGGARRGRSWVLPATPPGARACPPTLAVDMRPPVLG